MKTIIPDFTEVGKPEKTPQPSRGSQRIESAHDILRTRRHPLNHIFSPKVIAVIGATESMGSVGRTVFQNLGRGGFEGVVYPVNPKRASVLCVKAYPNIASVPEKVDLAVICTPATAVPSVIRDCAKAGVPGAIIISAGFKEIGKAGQKWNGRFSPMRRAAECASRTQLPRRHDPKNRIQRHLRRRPWPNRAMSASSARAAPFARPFWTGACGKTSASARSSPSVRCSMSAGAI